MKLLKCTFRSPLNGSIDCEELLSDTFGRVELNSEQMATLYHRNYELKEFLENNKEDLTYAVPEELSSCIVKAEFGDYTMYEGNLYLLTYVWVDDNELSGGTKLKIQEWITGQLSDGWGEGLEQREWMDERVYSKSTYFDEDTLSFEDSEDYCTASYYVNPWVSHEFYVELVDFEEDEMSVEPKTIASIELPNLSKRVLKFDNIMQIFMYATDEYAEGQAKDITKDIEEYSHVKGEYYLVEFQTPGGCQLVSRWVVAKGNFCAIYLPDKSCEDANYEGTQMPLEKAIIELLK